MVYVTALYTGHKSHVSTCLICFVQRETCRTYKKLQAVNSDRDPFLGWSSDSACMQCANLHQNVYVCVFLLNLCIIHFRCTPKCEQNQKTLDTLVQEVRVLHSNFSSSAVTGMATSTSLEV